MKTTIVIPTFWRGPAKDGSTCEFESDFVYEHAAPLDTEGTLGLTLESLSLLRGVEDFAVVVLAVPTRSELKQAVQIRVQTIVAQFEYRYPIMVIGPEELMLWRQRLAAKGMYQYDYLLSLDGYANVRNMCLLAAVQTSADVAVFIDDGEVYEDPDYLRKALEFIGREHEGGTVAGIAGCMIREDDSFLLPQADEAWQNKWGSISALNQIFAGIGGSKRLQKTQYANSGNMVIHREVFEKVPFDPSIPRGEAVDYLLNARLSGYEFYIDRELWLKSALTLPCAPSWFQLRLDIIRFARERAKLAAARDKAAADSVVEPEEFDPYPGRFLGSDLHDIVFETSIEMASGFYYQGLEQDAGESIMNIAISKAEARVGSEALEDYITVQQHWQEFIAVASGIGIWSAQDVAD